MKEKKDNPEYLFTDINTYNSFLKKEENIIMDI